ncbi:DNA-binding protein [Bradyrhizobium sp. SSBR45G]|uniref:bifunctional aminoglycoside phosphotransferase/ATP-binding protein n=1 Tax=unclassified Bradyrhizobium TaxID=2631580 RepID=UPI002342BA64|nr:MULTISPECIES: bifunctional aminoglycoside phosphotransferase/ATP-binding protein [unclassified Bradyrhizobium]GLH77471.1 DNA-binding protein [Bradyrhizobium sp. SSBR45G]GLH84423.1 DNA-binding protein [Bradyrhizobium sp. SSBR45R]
MTSPHDQDLVFAFLCDLHRHPDVRRIDTHAASVFLIGDRALKIKRAVRLPFLDYSTLALRKAACAKEVEVNRPFAPDIYLRVVAITTAPDGSFDIDGSGTPVEYAVEMRRFDDSKTLDHLARSGQVSAGLADQLAETIATSHRVAAEVPLNTWIDCIPRWIDASVASLAASPRFPQTEVEAFSKLCHSAFSRLTPLLERRATNGHVRRCHGDLHLANIVMIEDKPVLFDAIEFDESIATIDVLYDLAFPLMDLLHFGLPVAANHLLNQYFSIAAPDQIDGLALLPLFMSIRAAIRAQVFLAKLDRERADHANADASAILSIAESYFKLARELVQPAPPTMIAIGGLSGTGKSALARALAPVLSPRPGAIVLRSDVLRKTLFGVGQTDRLPKQAYTPESSTRVYREQADRAARVLAQGFPVIVDAVFARPDEREAIKNVAKQLNVRFAGIFLSADLRTRQQRIQHRVNDASDATSEVARDQERYDIGALDWLQVNASGTPEATLQQCLSTLRTTLEADVARLPMTT